MTERNEVVKFGIEGELNATIPENRGGSIKSLHTDVDHNDAFRISRCESGVLVVGLNGLPSASSYTRKIEVLRDDEGTSGVDDLMSVGSVFRCGDYIGRDGCTTLASENEDTKFIGSPNLSKNADMNSMDTIVSIEGSHLIEAEGLVTGTGIFWIV